MLKLFLCFLVSFHCFNLWPQHNSRSQHKFGIIAGSGAQTISGSPFVTKAKITFMGGIWVQLQIDKRWTMRAEFTNISKGTGLGLQQPKYGDYWLRLSYFEVPLLFQYTKKNGYLEFGPSIAALINTGEYADGVTLPYQREQYPFSKKDLSFTFGTGFEFNNLWRIGLRLTHSVLPVRKQLPTTVHAGYNKGIVLVLARQLILKTRKNKDSASDL